MRRKILHVVAVFAVAAVLVVGGWTANADAQAFLGEFCWKLDPFIDTIRVGVTTSGQFFALNGRWVAGTSYSIGISGTAAGDLVAPGMDVSLSAVNLADPAPNFPNSWRFHARLLNGLNGIWKFIRTEDGFVNSGSFTFLPSCPPGSEPTGGAAANQ